MVPDMTYPGIYGQNGKVSPNVHIYGRRVLGHSCRTVNTPDDHRSKLLIGDHLLIDLQLDLSKRAPWRLL